MAEFISSENKKSTKGEFFLKRNRKLKRTEEVFK